MSVPDSRPIPGSWYETDEGDVFMVTDFDETRGMIDIRHLNGRVEEMDAATWRDMELFEIEPVEEWHASMDDFLAGRRRK